MHVLAPSETTQETTLIISYPSRLHFGFFLSGAEAGGFDDEIVMSLDTKSVSRKIKLQHHGQSTVTVMALTLDEQASPKQGCPCAPATTPSKKACRVIAYKPFVQLIESISVLFEISPGYFLRRRIKAKPPRPMRAAEDGSGTATVRLTVFVVSFQLKVLPS